MMLRMSFLLWLAVPLTAATRSWEQSRFEEFDKGVAERVALRSDGRLLLAPRFEQLYDAPVAYLWALARDSKGNLFAGGGPGARVFRIAPDGKTGVHFETDALEIHALAVDARDNLYAATSPDSKIYRIAPDGRSSLFAEPKVKYIWAMAFNSRGELLAATGDGGEVLRLDDAGRATSFFKTDESHIRALLVDRNDEVVVGTDPGGLVIRIPAGGGKGFVVHQSGKKEITALARDREGAIYAAGVGTRARPAAPVGPGFVPPPAPATPMPSAIGGPAFQTTVTPAPPALPPSSLRAGVTGGSEVIRIAPDGSPRKLWSSNDDVVYALGFTAAGRLLVATGNQGRIYQVENEHLYTLLIRSAPAQVTALLEVPGGRVYAATGNVGKVYRLGPELEASGSFESEVFDAGGFARWGRLSWKGSTPDGSSVTLRVRSGNLNAPTQYWSPWSQPITTPDGGPIDSPGARFVQWKAMLEARSTQSPLVESVSLAYLPKNSPPAITDIETTPPNHRFPDSTLQLTGSKTLTLPAFGSRPARSAKPAVTFPGMNPAKGYLGLRWQAQDENEDELVHKVEIRGVNEQTWKLLKDDLTDPFLSWDSTAFADGLYVARVTATDSGSNPRPEALSGSKQSAPFLIDNTPPAVSGLAAAPEAGRLRLRFRASDALSLIQKSQYSLDGAEWQVMLPSSRLFDSRDLDYDFLTDPAGAGEHTIAVRVFDARDNLAAAKVVVR